MAKYIHFFYLLQLFLFCPSRPPCALPFFVLQSSCSVTSRALPAPTTPNWFHYEFCLSRLFFPLIRFSVRRTQFMALWFCLFLLSSIIFQFPCSATVYNLPFLLHFFFFLHSSIFFTLFCASSAQHDVVCIQHALAPRARPPLIVLRCCQRWKIILFGWKYIGWLSRAEPERERARKMLETRTTGGMERRRLMV